MSKVGSDWKSTRSLGLFAAFFSYTLGVQDGGLACPSSLVLAKSTRSLGLFTAFFSYTLGVQDGGLACPSSLVLAKSTRSLGLFAAFLSYTQDGGLAFSPLSLHSESETSISQMYGYNAG